MTTDPSLNAVVQRELAQYAHSGNPTQQALLDLYRKGLVRIGGVRDGQIVWRATTEADA
jgi:hypothetical protein